MGSVPLPLSRLLATFPLCHVYNKKSREEKKEVSNPFATTWCVCSFFVEQNSRIFTWVNLLRGERKEGEILPGTLVRGGSLILRCVCILLYYAHTHTHTHIHTQQKNTHTVKLCVCIMHKSRQNLHFV